MLTISQIASYAGVTVRAVNARLALILAIAAA